GQSSGRSAGLTLNLSSNNPFRNRAASPNSGLSPNSFPPPSPHSPFDDPPSAQQQRPVSRNPFFDPSDTSQTQRVQSPASMASANENRKSPTAEELFDQLIIIDDDNKPMAKPAKPAPRPDGARGPPRGPPGGPPRSENVPPRGGRGPPPTHRPTRSQEEAMRARRMQERNGSTTERSLLDSPQKRPMERKPRRNSESSVIELTEEEKKQKELRRRERERRHRDGKGKDKSGKPSRKLDLIDQLDATSIYGTGLFHHDGPFDALNPHRNRNGSRHAPMQAFPKDSANMSLGGAGPLNSKPDHKALMGKYDEEAYLDYNQSRRKGQPAVYDEPLSTKKVANVFDPHARASILHGDESIGLGTSTFLEGTPAAQTDIQRRQAEVAQASMEQGLQRKKSLAQRIRGINRGPRDMNNRSRVTNPDGLYGPRSGDLPTSSSTGERNPFFNDYDKGGEERMTVRRQDTNPKPPVSPDSPPRGYGLERRSTADATAAMSSEPGKSQGNGGFMTRVKSLKGGRRQRPEPPQAAVPSYPAP
ncbi:Pal1 cell morphology protein-domain-containing protein, partial [Truncatella angustata]